MKDRPQREIDRSSARSSWLRTAAFEYLRQFHPEVIAAIDKEAHRRFPTKSGRKSRDPELVKFIGTLEHK
jgi:hypothetical protein